MGVGGGLSWRSSALVKPVSGRTMWLFHVPAVELSEAGGCQLHQTLTSGGPHFNLSATSIYQWACCLCLSYIWDILQSADRKHQFFYSNNNYIINSTKRNHAVIARLVQILQSYSHVVKPQFRPLPNNRWKSRLYAVFTNIFLKDFARPTIQVL